MRRTQNDCPTPNTSASKDIIVFPAALYTPAIAALVRTPPNTGPTMPMRRIAMGMNRANLCWRSEARDSKAAGRWKTREETAAHRNTPYHISEKSLRDVSLPRFVLFFLGTKFKPSICWTKPTSLYLSCMSHNKIDTAYSKDGLQTREIIRVGW